MLNKLSVVNWHAIKSPLTVLRHVWCWVEFHPHHYLRGDIYNKCFSSSKWVMLGLSRCMGSMKAISNLCYSSSTPSIHMKLKCANSYKSTKHNGGLVIYPICVPFYISDCIHYKVWYEITYPFPNINGASLGIDAYFHPTLYWPCDYSGLLGLRD